MKSGPSNYTLPYSVLSAVPCAGHSSLLLRYYNTRLLLSLTQIAQALGITIPVPSDVRPFAPDLAPTLTSAVYCHYFRLQEAFSSRDMVTAQRHLHELQSIIATPQPITPIINRLGDLDGDNEFIIRPFEANVTSAGTIRFDPIDALTLDTHRSLVSTSIGLISGLDKDFYDEVAVLVQRVALYRGHIVVGLTSPHFFGTVGLSVPQTGEDPLAYYIEHLTHETSHLYLNMILSFDPLVTNDRTELFAAPIRTDDRPMLGIFHATFVLSRIVRLIAKYRANATDDKASELSALLESAVARFQKGCHVLDHSAKFTEVGRQIFLTMTECVLSTSGND